MPGKREMMRFDKGVRLLSSMVLMGALAAPVGLQAQERNDHDRDDQGKVQRRDNDDRRWNDSEEPHYKQWYSQKYKGKEYREYSRMNKRDRDDYWKWRHKHGDNDHDRDDHRDKDKDKDHDRR